MKNLKRALSFAVAAVMLVGMMAVGTSAFTDDAAIENDVAVNVMNQLGIIAGKPDGSFDPTATVTRGEMAKMICVALNGGKAPVLDTAVSSYPDTVGHWAAGYIEYCSSLGIVAGSTDGNFYPNAPITGTEAAKMVLIALGYNAENEKFVNNKDWSTNINVVANKKGLYEDVTSLPGAPISRDNAAQMLYNGMNAVMVVYDYQLTTMNGDLVSVAVAKDTNAVADTILKAKFALQTATATLAGVSYDADEDEYTYAYADSVNLGDGLTTGSVDYSELFMQNVTVLYKPVTGGADKLYGMFGNGAVLATATGADVDGSGFVGTTNEKIEVDEVEIDAIAADLPVYYFLQDATADGVVSGLTGAAAAYTLDIVDYDGDGVADHGVVYPFSVSKVSYVGKEDVNTGSGVYSLEDDTIYAGVAKNDWVVVTGPTFTVDGKAVVTKVAASTGTVEAFKADGTVKIDGEWYTNVSGDSVAIGTEYDLIALNGYIYDAAEVEEETTVADIVYVMKADTAGTGFDEGTQKVKVMFTDGTTAIVTADKINGAKVATTPGLYAFNNDASACGLYTFKVDADGNYELTAIYAGDYDAAYEVSDDTNSTIVDGKVHTYRFNDDAVIFVTEADGDVAVVKGSTINKWADTVASNIHLYMEAKNGFKYAVVGTLGVTADPSAQDGTGYGLVTESAIKVKSGDYYYAEFSIWNGTETVVVTEELANASTAINVAQYTKGALVSYTKLEGNEVESTAVIGQQTAVTAWDNTNITFDGFAGEYEVDEDTVVIYIDSKNVKGVEGGEIVIAGTQDGGAYIENVYAVTNDVAGTVTVLFVDVNNDMDDAVEGAL